ncbi:MAG: hypothetical protein PF439_12435 [Helicobacteraceae bacterium]|jgi:hypothetical protein|nr:hypothetical protein [Helicobacteraceae bacterium]
MEIKYVGPKPLISTSGVSFDTEKSDKFIYFHALVQLINAIDHEYVEEQVYVYEVEGRMVKASEIAEMIRQCCPEISEVINEAKGDAGIYVDDTLNRAGRSLFLTKIDSHALASNLILMQDYTVQRYINKSIYYHLISKFIERLRHKKIAYISVPVHNTYFHVLNTVQRGLTQLKSPVTSKITFHTEGNESFVKLTIVD